MALWKEVPGYEGLYLVSDDGRIYSLPRVVSNGRGEYVRDGRVLRPGLRGKDGIMYACVDLSDGASIIRKSVHRIVAEAFVTNPNPAEYDVINHIDHNTLNNCAENLEWCTQQYNNEYGHNKPVKQISLEGEVIAEYKNITYASEITNIGRRAINNALTGWSQTAGGYIWKYANKEGSEDLSH